MKFPKAIIFSLIISLGSFVDLNPLHAAVTATSIYNLGYPVGLAEDSSGNIFIVDDHNNDVSKQGIVVVPAASGTLFGQSVTAGTPLKLVEVALAAGVAVSSTGTLMWSLQNGNIYALANSSRTVFGISVPANTTTLIKSGTGLKGALDFDSSGNLFGVHIATGSFSVLPVSSGTLYGNSVTANTSAEIFSNGSHWFWDLALDSAGNIFVADGWGLQGVFVMPISTGSLYGQSVTANTFSRVTPLGTAQYAGIDIDASNVLFVNTYFGLTKALSSTTKTVFQTNLIANVLSSLNSTSGYIDQGLLVTSNGDLITGGPANTYRLVAAADVTPPDSSTIEAEIAAALAAQRTAEALREAEKKATRTEISNGFFKFKAPTLQQFKTAEIFGITEKNFLSVNKELLSLPLDESTKISVVERVANKYRILDAICVGDKFNTIYTHDLISVGLIPKEYQAGITYSLRLLPIADRDEYFKIYAAINNQIALNKIRNERMRLIRLKYK